MQAFRIPQSEANLIFWRFLSLCAAFPNCFVAHAETRPVQISGRVAELLEYLSHFTFSGHSRLSPLAICTICHYLCSVKWFYQTLALYFFVLSCLPCNDGEHGHAQSPGAPAVQISFSADEHGCSGHEHCNDFCSPLCGCHCCSAVFTFQQRVVLSFAKIDILESTRVFPENTVPLQDMAFAIDHPPQLS